MKYYHPRKDDKGRLVQIKHPSQPTAQEAWADAMQIASVIPDFAMLAVVGGIAVRQWEDKPNEDSGWEALAKLTDFDEPAFINGGKKSASGAVVIEPDMRVWIVSPTNQFGGYTNTFPKGKLESAQAMSWKANALKEVFEETGLKIELTAFLCDSKRDTSTTRFYMARRLTGNPAAMGWESQAVHLVPLGLLRSFVRHTNDKAVIKALEEHLNA